MKHLSILIIFLIALGCDQVLVPVQAAQKDELPPEVMLYSPAEGEVFHASVEVEIALDVIENFKLHDVLIEVFEQGKDSLLWDFYTHTHVSSLEIREEIPRGLLPKGSFRVSIESQDHDYNLKSVERFFIIQ